MKRKFILKGVLLIMSSVILLSSASCSSSSPDTIVTSFFSAIKDSDLIKAKSYLVDNDSTLEFSNERNKSIVVKVFSMMKYDIILTKINGDSAVVNVKVTTPDMGKITLKVINAVMEKVAKMSEDEMSIEISDSEEIAEQFYNEMLSDPKVQMTTSELEINLTKKNSKWLIKGDKKFKNVITGNMIKAW